MAPPKFVKVVSYSSEDPKLPAVNLTTSKGKWRCREEGEKQAWVILQLDSLINISHVDIGNLASAFIEVQVGRVGMDDNKFSVLLPSSSFMGPEESRNMVNETRVRMFASDKLNQTALSEKWNLVKIICSQPFNKHTKYGISFISLSAVGESIAKTPEKKSSEPPKVKLGAFILKNENEDDFSVGSYFNKKKDTVPQSSTSGSNSGSISSELRADRTLASLALQSSAKEEKKLHELKVQYEKAAESHKDDRQKKNLPRRDLLPGEANFVPDDKEDPKDKHTASKNSERDKDKHSKDRHRNSDKAEHHQHKDKHRDKNKESHKGKRERSRERHSDSSHRRDSQESSKHDKEKRRENGDDRGKEKRRENGDDRSKEKRREKSDDKNKEKRRENGDCRNKEKRRENGDDRSKEKRRENDNREKRRQNAKYAPFNELMAGVTFVISGFQNPLRGEIRSKACKMGATYKGDWDGRCTHLVCAFANTPKFNQVKGKGRIVTKDWIEQSFSQRKKLNWKKYSLTKSPDEESEEEILEGQLEPDPEPARNDNSARAGTSNSAMDSDEGDTDDEIERVMNARKVFNNDEDITNNEEDYNMDEDTDDEIERAQKKIQEQEKENVKTDTPSKKRKSESPNKEAKKHKMEDSSSKNGRRHESGEDAAYDVETDEENSDDAYSAETDVEDDNLKDLKSTLKKLPSPDYPQIFKGSTFFLKGLEEKEAKLIERYVICYGGEISPYNQSSVGYILTKAASKSDIRDAKAVNSSVKVLRPDWVFKCCDKLQLVSTERYSF